MRKKNEKLDLSVNDGELMLTTIDNPYNPKTDYRRWREWDESNGYFTESLIDRYTNTPKTVTDLEYDEFLTQIYLEICEHDQDQKYKLI